MGFVPRSSLDDGIAEMLRVFHYYEYCRISSPLEKMQSLAQWENEEWRGFASGLVANPRKLCHRNNAFEMCFE